MCLRRTAPRTCFGFIRTLEECTRRSSYDAEIFCHVSDIEDGNSLRPGSPVTFVSFFDRQKGKERAVHVRGGAWRAPRW